MSPPHWNNETSLRDRIPDGPRRRCQAGYVASDRARGRRGRRSRQVVALSTTFKKQAAALRQVCRPHPPRRIEESFMRTLAGGRQCRSSGSSAAADDPSICWSTIPATRVPPLLLLEDGRPRARCRKRSRSSARSRASWQRGRAPREGIRAAVPSVRPTFRHMPLSLVGITVFPFRPRDPRQGDPDPPRWERRSTSSGNSSGLG